MEKEVSQERVSSRRERKSEVSFRLVERDLEILHFLYDQKFCSLEGLYFRFFDGRKAPTEPLPPNFRVARQRLQILKRAGLITSQRVYSESKSVYLLAPQGFRLFSSRFPDLVFAQAVREVDFRNYDHDTRVNICRIALERSGKVKHWTSERKIRALGFRATGLEGSLPETIIPDGIFINARGERIALELESTLRKKSRFKFKVSEYESVFQSYRPLLNKVLFVACVDALGKDLSEIIHGKEGFLLENYSHFLRRLYRPEKAVVKGRL